MNSSLSIPSGSLLEMLSDILDIAEQLHTASINFTVLREKGLPIGFQVYIQYHLAEQKPDVRVSSARPDVENL